MDAAAHVALTAGAAGGVEVQRTSRFTRRSGESALACVSFPVEMVPAVSRCIRQRDELYAGSLLLQALLRRRRYHRQWYPAKSNSDIREADLCDMAMRARRQRRR